MRKEFYKGYLKNSISPVDPSKIPGRVCAIDFMRYLLHVKSFVTNKYTLDFSNMLFVGKSLRYSSLDTLINKFQAQCTESLVCRHCIRK